MFMLSNRMLFWMLAHAPIPDNCSPSNCTHKHCVREAIVHMLLAVIVKFFACSVKVRVCFPVRTSIDVCKRPEIRVRKVATTQIAVRKVSASQIVASKIETGLFNIEA